MKVAVGISRGMLHQTGWRSWVKSTVGPIMLCASNRREPVSSP